MESKNNVEKNNTGDDTTGDDTTGDDNTENDNKKNKKSLQKFYLEDTNTYEIGVDEAGRGPLFGRVYTDAVILPKDDSFDHYKMKDSKKFHSKKKI